MSGPSSPSDSKKPLLNHIMVDTTFDYPESPNVATLPGGDSKSMKGESMPSSVEDKYHMDEFIPRTHDHRTLVLCFDGTGDQFDADNSNIVQFFSMLKKDDKSEQMVYYQAGIGTYTIPQIATPLMAKLSKTLDMMLGVHLNAHVMGGYEFLMENYEAGDKICIFGFSRGAYTARALAGMIHKVGLLPVCNHQQVPFAYKMYATDDDNGWKQSTAFKRAFSINVDIEFVGVWDTVDSVGIVPRRLPFTKVNDNIRYFRHAISLDEHRARFKPNTWYRPTGKDMELGLKKHEMPRSKKHHHEGKSGQAELERRYSESNETATKAEEVWFAGCHCDIGGGSVPNGTRNSLARIPLRWMIRQCFIANTGIMFHKSTFRKVGLNPDTLYPSVHPRPAPLYQNPCTRTSPLPRPGVVDDRMAVVYSDGDAFISEELEDLDDALSPMYDQLKLKKIWWVLEVLPQSIRFQKDDNNLMVNKMKVNMGSGRHIARQRQDGVKFHRTVDIRIEAEGLAEGKYWPKAKLAVKPNLVD